MIIAMRIKMQGFIVLDYESQYPTARKELAQWLAEGKLQRRETIIKGGLPAAEQALLDLFKGVNTGMFLTPIPASSPSCLVQLANILAGKLLVEVKADDGDLGSRL